MSEVDDDQEPSTFIVEEEVSSYSPRIKYYGKTPILILLIAQFEDICLPDTSSTETEVGITVNKKIKVCHIL